MSFCESSATGRVSLSNEPCMTRPALIDLNPFELKYYPFMNSLDKYNESCNVVNDSSTKIGVFSETKDIMVKYLI